MHCNVGILMLVAVGLLVTFVWQSTDESLFGSIIAPAPAHLQQQWNYSSFSFKPTISDWVEQRLIWLEEHQNVRARTGGKPKVLMASGSAPYACDPAILSHLLVRASKNKMDYCRIHDIEYFYNLDEPDQDFSDRWIKLPVVRMLMLQHPEVGDISHACLTRWECGYDRCTMKDGTTFCLTFSLTYSVSD
jgi:hypothetical protein